MSTIIVTAFIPLGRKTWKGFERSDDQYIEYFRFWARLNNMLIVFTVPEYKDTVKAIREEYGLLEKTKIEIINDYRGLDEELYHSIAVAMDKPLYNQFRFYNSNPEAINPDYNYVMMLKFFFVKKVAEEYENDMICWIDFGYNHGYYLDSAEFDFELELTSEKVILFITRELDDTPIFQAVRYTINYFQGSVFCGPARRITEFCDRMRENQIALNKVGLADQDQTIMLMSYRSEPDDYKVIKLSYAFEQIKILTQRKFTCRDTGSGRRRSLIQKIFDKLVYYSRFLRFKIRGV